METQSKKIIFLDIDGVLNTFYTKELTPDGGLGVEPQKLQLLSDIVQKTNAQIILVSSWKDYWGKDANDSGYWKKDGKYLDREFEKFGLKIEDKTKGDDNLRGQGIDLFLKENNVSNFVILDDYVYPDYKKYNLLKNLCQCHGMEEGLTKEIAKKAIKILNKKVD